MTFDTVTRNLQENCFLDDNGIAAGNQCRISGFSNKCPAGSSLTYASEKNSIDAKIMCPLDSVAQSDWREASQKGLCGCDAALLDSACSVLVEKMNCECFACPAGTTLGFAYSCDQPIVGPCTSFDCYGRCNEKYDPGNLAGDRITFAPTTFPSDEKVTVEPSAASFGIPNNNMMVTAVMILAFFRMIM
mmetsp:Transcript_14817/g.41288  ORF Transcript_14817/g.41288 Transcript_14817/m.41288 type:complete len:189 (+) Transcript_14817:186-752(+)